MKLISFILLLFLSLSIRAQVDAVPTDTFVITGAVKQETKISLKNTTGYAVQSLDSFVIYNHLLERKRVLKNLKGMSLKEVLAKTALDENSPKLFSEFYFTCIASDGYKIVFSWNEIFNTGVGDQIMIVTGIDGTDITTSKERIIILSAADKATGRRFIKNVEKIRVERVK